MSPFLRSNRSFLHRFIRPYGLSIVGASFFSLLLSLCATSLAILVGPTLRLLLDMDFTKTVSLTELFGPNLGHVLRVFWPTQELSMASLLSSLPYMLLTLAVLKLTVGTSQYFLWERVSELMSRDLRQYLNDRFLNMHPSLRKHRDHEQREAILSTLITTDVKLIREYLVHFYGGLPREMLHIVFIGQTLVLLSPKLCALFFFGVIPGVVIVRLLGRKLKKRAQLALQDYSQLTEWLQQRLMGVETIKHYRTESLESTKMEHHSELMVQKFLRAARVKARSGPMLEFVGIAAMTLVLFIAFHDIQNNTLQASAAISFFAGLAMLAQSGNTVGRYLNSNREGAAAIERVRGFLLDLQKAEDGVVRSSISYSPIDSVLTLDAVSASYPGSHESAMSQFSYTFEKGKIYCLSGPSGAGKSTLFNVILNNLIPHQGQITFANNVQARGLGYLPQDIQLFYGTIADNVIYPNREVNTARLEKILRSVGLWKTIENLPQGVHTIVGAKGRDLSGGQYQRIHLARILYHDYPLILIDEGTSSLDPENENLICELLLEKVKEGCTILMVSHRPTPLQYADTILRIQNGRLMNTAH